MHPKLSPHSSGEILRPAKQRRRLKILVRPGTTPPSILVLATGCVFPVGDSYYYIWKHSFRYGSIFLGVDPCLEIWIHTGSIIDKAAVRVRIVSGYSFEGARSRVLRVRGPQNIPNSSVERPHRPTNPKGFEGRRKHKDISSPLGPCFEWFWHRLAASPAVFPRKLDRFVTTSRKIPAPQIHKHTVLEARSRERKAHLGGIPPQARVHCGKHPLTTNWGHLGPEDLGKTNPGHGQTNQAALPWDAGSGPNLVLESSKANRPIYGHGTCTNAV
jgi:hypothetical protein